MNDEHVENALEIGLGLVGALLLGGLGLLAFGRLGGDATRRKRYGEGPPREARCRRNGTRTSPHRRHDN